jgi:L-arabinose transport system ATP-binding protein
MVGRELANIYNYAPRPHRGPGFAVEGLLGPGLTAPCTLSAHAGEILGLFGLVGAGRTELLRLVYGAAPRRAGRIFVAGREVSVASPRDAIEAGVVLCPEDRKKEGIVPVRSVLENINLSARRRTARGGFLINEAWEQRNARERIDQLKVRTPSARQLIRHLSGGNQQKVILAKWLATDPKVLLLDEPTRGIDVNAKREIYAFIDELARLGLGLIVVSSELPEILALADRVLVMCEGRKTAEFARADATAEKILAAAFPVTTATAAA